MSDTEALSIDRWCPLELAERRQLLVDAITDRLDDLDFVREVTIEIGPPKREYDLTVVVLTDVGRLREPFWSHARATIFCDTSIHPANRAQVGLADELNRVVERLRTRLSVPYKLESRGLTFAIEVEPKVERRWTAEHARLRKRTAVSREDVVQGGADVDIRDLLAHFYSGPSLRLAAEDGEAFLLPAASEVEGPTVTLCYRCGKWKEGSAERCGDCGSEEVDVVIAARPPRRQP